jgi:hypothetical protein
MADEENFHRVNELTKEIKKAARQDKRRWLQERLQETEHLPFNSKDKWSWVKRLRAG